MLSSFSFLTITINLNLLVKESASLGLWAYYTEQLWISVLLKELGVTINEHSSNNSKHNESYTLMGWVIGAGRVNSELQSVRSGSDSERRGKYELACLPSCMDFEQICCNCWCKQSINRKRYSHNNRPRTFAYKLCHSFLHSLTAGNIRSKPCKPKLLFLNVKYWRGTLGKCIYKSIHRTH